LPKEVGYGLVPKQSTISLAWKHTAKRKLNTFAIIVCVAHHSWHLLRHGQVGIANVNGAKHKTLAHKLQKQDW
jgi:hypothetical protein